MKKLKNELDYIKVSRKRIKSLKIDRLLCSKKHLTEAFLFIED